jgi:uncharacterized protein
MVHLFEHDGLTVAYHREGGDFYAVGREYEAPLKALIESGFAAPKSVESHLHAELRGLFPGEGAPKPRVDDAALDAFLRSSAKRVNRLSLILTSACNLRCRYCYEGSELMPQANAHTGSMSEECVDAALGYFQRHYDSIDSLMFFGGEPLLRFPLIAGTVERVARANEKKPGFIKGLGIITNGTLLTKKIAKAFKEWGMRVTLSCDGPAPINDFWRVDAHGKGSWEAVNRGAILLREAGIDFSVQATFTPEHVRRGYRPRELARSFSEWDVKAHHIVHGQAPGMWSQVDIEALVTAYLSDQDECLAAIEEGRLADAHLFSRSVMILRALVMKRSSPLRCPAGSELAVDTSGNLYPCFMFASYPETCIGSVYDSEHDAVQEKTVDFMKLNMKVLNASCAECWANRICSGCMGANYALSGDFDGNEEVNCALVKALAQGLMASFARMQSDGARWERFMNNFKDLHKEVPDERC